MISPATITAYRIAIGGTRFLTAHVTGAACFVLLWFGKLDPGSFVTVILGTVAVYISADSYTRKHAKAHRDDVPSDSPSPGNGGNGV